MLKKTVTLNGDPYTFEYDWDAQVRAEELTGLNLLVPSANSAGFRAVLLARLLKNHPDMTVAKANALIPLNIEVISNAFHDIGEGQNDVEEEIVVELEAAGNGVVSGTSAGIVTN
jgi:hypothetical protein